MRRLAWMLLLVLVFTIPWEYSLDFGEPWGNVARLAGLALLLAAIPAVLQARRIRAARAFHWMVLALFLWFCCSVFWSIDPRGTGTRLPGYFQEMAIVWFLWEFTESRDDLNFLLRAYVAGAWVLALLTVGNLVFPGTPGQVRFVPEGQDPNDVARFLVLGLPMAALLIESESGLLKRILAIGYLPLGSAGILLTASRGGFLAAVVALGGCGILLARKHARAAMAGLATLPLLAAALWMAAPHETLLRISTIPEQLMGGDLNQRWNIWAAGWATFARAPVAGWGAGSFVLAAGLAPIDTAHNTALALATEGGFVALGLGAGILILCVVALMRAEGPVRVALATALAAWLFLSLVSNVQESRSTWFLLGMIAVAGRLGGESAVRVRGCLPSSMEYRPAPGTISGVEG